MVRIRAEITFVDDVESLEKERRANREGKGRERSSLEERTVQNGARQDVEAGTYDSTHLCVHGGNELVEGGANK
jgi:hypothetical protein